MIEVEGLSALVADLALAPGKAQRRSYEAVRASAAKVQQTARQFSDGLAHARLYPASITTETKIKPTAFEAEIGPDKDLPQGALGNLLEYGSVNNAPIAHLGPAHDLVGPDFERAIAGGAGL